MTKKYGYSSINAIRILVDKRSARPVQFIGYHHSRATTYYAVPFHAIIWISANHRAPARPTAPPRPVPRRLMSTYRHFPPDFTP